MSSKRRLRRKGCTGKVVYDKDTAFLVAKRLWNAGKRMHAYKCVFGDHWHTGHFGKVAR